MRVGGNDHPAGQKYWIYPNADSRSGREVSDKACCTKRLETEINLLLGYILKLHPDPINNYSPIKQAMN